MTRYGFGWMGSKNKIAKDIIGALPSADTFVDLFCGGCAVTHCALLSGKYKHFIANDIKGTAVFFKQAIEGKIENLYEPVTKEEFYRRRDTDVKIAFAWSFGNNGRSYLWGKDLEDIKLTAFKMLTAQTVTERYALYKSFVKMINNNTESLSLIEVISRAQAVERLQQIQAVEALLAIERLQLDDVIECFTKDYQEIEIPPNSTVYCDIPYSQTYAQGKDYRNAYFDTERFWSWAESRDFPVFVSEYTAPDAFAEIWSKSKTCAFSPQNNSKQTVEKIFVQKRFQDQFKSRQGELYA